MKMIRRIIVGFLFALVFMTNVHAASVQANISLDGTNRFGRRIDLTLTCVNPATNCSVDSATWYTNTSKSTTGGTQVSTSKSSFTPTKEMVGKYIYVEAVVKATGYDSATIKAVTSSPVDNYLKQVSKSRYTINVNAESGSVSAGLSIKIADSTPVSGDAYYVIIKSDNTVPVIEESGTRCNILSRDDIVPGPNISIGEDWYMLKEGLEDRFWVITYNQSNGTCTITSEAIKVTRPDLPAIGQRFKTYVDSNRKTLESLVFFPHRGTRGDHMKTIKIGVITDKAVLNKLAKKTSDSMNALMSYARSATNGTTYKVLDTETGIDLKNLKVTNGSYYYIYTTYTDSTYRNMEDVTIAMGDHDWLTNDITWSIEGADEVKPSSSKPTTTTTTTSKSKTIKENPKTGSAVSYIVLGGGLVVLIAGVVVLNKKHKFMKLK
jgi:LPXTG-motif cell wall-anchored protein